MNARRKAILKAAQEIDEGHEWYCCCALIKQDVDEVEFQNFYGKGMLESWWGDRSDERTGKEDRKARDEKIIALLLFAEATK